VTVAANATRGRTVAERILSDASGTDARPGDIVRVEYDLAASHDLSTPQGVKRLDAWGASVKDPDRLAVVPDHMVPSHNERAQRNYTTCVEFAEREGIERFYPQSETGLMHAVLPEDGHVGPGDVVIGSDSHTVTYGAVGAFATGISYTDLAFAWAEGWTWLRVPETVRLEYEGEPSEWVRGKDLVLYTLGRLGVDGAVYRALEFGGPLLADVPMDDRFSMSNMAIEAGAMVGVFDADDAMREYAREHVGLDADGAEPFTCYEADADAAYERTLTLDCDGLEPQVAVPSLPANARPVREVAGVAVDQAVIGSCTNCREEDLRVAAEVLEGRRVADGVRLIVTPGSRRIQRTAFAEGWMETFHDAGATFGSPGCGACFGEHIGVLDEDEVAVSTTNRNFVGRMGANSSEVYLANPAVAAASAVAGELVHPEEVVG
jgi:3-isopropylmalate/(R)-2-methylmalate dehydratase large subunit